MKKIIVFLFLVFFCYSCGTTKKVVEPEKPTKMLNLIDTIFSRQQLDSLCVADTISLDLDTWMKITFVDYESNSAIIEYSYIKTIHEDEILYRVIKDGENFKIIKRLTDN